MTDMNAKGFVAANGEAEWHYHLDPKAPPAPKGCKVQLLTEGRIAIYGEHKPGDGTIAWSPLIKRNKDLERELGLL